MANIRANPKKAKPHWLKIPCSICTQWEEDESALDPIRKALWNNQKMPDGNRCRYHPLFCDPNDKDKCPYQHLIGKTIIGLYCDTCGKEFELLEPTDPRLEEYIRDPFKVDLCNDCKMKSEKDLEVQRVITVLQGGKKIITK